MRCFIAIDIGDRIRSGLTKLQQKLQAQADIKKGDAKWVRPRTIHLTLKFLGEIKPEQSVDVCNAVKEVASRHDRFNINVAGVGFFGGQSARVLWVGAGDDSAKLLQLHQDLEEQLEISGWPKEGRKFSGHLTLCRIRNSKAGRVLAGLAEDYRDYELGMISADSVSVYQSQLTPDGPVYTLLSSCELCRP